MLVFSSSEFNKLVKELRNFAKLYLFLSRDHVHLDLGLCPTLFRAFFPGFEVAPFFLAAARFIPSTSFFILLSTYFTLPLVPGGLFWCWPCTEIRIMEIFILLLGHVFLVLTVHWNKDDENIYTFTRPCFSALFSTVISASSV